MAYTYEQLTKAYAAVHGGIEPTGEAASQLRLLTNASYTDTQRLAFILNSADQSTSVAVLSYQFFTGKAPSAEGMDYLLKSGATNLNSEAYAKFNLENRFMNFATNLALNGEGKAAFEASYGSMTYAAYVAAIYETIIGKAYAEAAGLDPAKTIQDIIARQDLILQSARNNGVIGPNATQAEIDLALKAATAAYLLAEGIKADVGAYAGATNNFMIAVATGKAAYGTNILETHAPTPGSGSTGGGQTIDNPPELPGLPEPQPEPEAPPQTSFTLTTGADIFTGSDGDDTFTGTSATYSSADALDGGAGRDTLNLTATPVAGTAYPMPNDGFTGIEVVNVTSDAGLLARFQNLADITDLNVTAGTGALDLEVNATAKVTATVTGQGSYGVNINGGGDISVISTGATTGLITIGATDAPTGDVVVSRELTGAVTGGAITVTGGKTVSVTQTAVDPLIGTQRNGAVTVTGSALTTEVTVKAAPAFNSGGAVRTANDVMIIDTNDAGTITKVTVDSYHWLTIRGTALSDLSLANGSGNIAITMSGMGIQATDILNLALDNLTGGALSDYGVYKTLNITTSARASTLDGVNLDELKTLTLAGDSRLTVNGDVGAHQLQTVTIRGAASLTANLSGNSALTLVDTTASSGTTTVTINALRTSFTGGAGVDNVKLSMHLIGKAIDLGGGDDTLTLDASTTHADIVHTIEGGAGLNTLVLEATDAQNIANGGPSRFADFQTIVLTNAFVENIDIGRLSPDATTVRTEGGAGLTLTNATNIQTLELIGAGTAYTLQGNWGGANDALAVKLQGAGGSVNFAFSGVTAAGIETVNITSNDINQTGNAQNWLTWLGNDVKTITASGDGDLNLTAASTALTAVDASGLTSGDFQWSSVGLTGAATIKGSAIGTNTIDLRSLGATGSFTYTGGTGADHIRIAGGANTINLVSDSAVDKITVEGANTAAAYTTINGLQAGDQIVFNFAMIGALTEITGQTTLAGYLAAGSIHSDGSTPMAEFFVIGSDTYLLLDRSLAYGFQDGTDVLIKLAGVTTMGNLSGNTFIV